MPNKYKIDDDNRQTTMNFEGGFRDGRIVSYIEQVGAQIRVKLMILPCEVGDCKK